MSLFLRIALTFLSGLPLGWLTLSILDQAPLTSLDMHPEGDAGGKVILHGISLTVIGFVDGYFNRAPNSDQLVRNQGRTILALMAGMFLSMLVCVWPIPVPDITGRLAQFVIGLGSVIYFGGAHIAGVDVFEKHFLGTIRLHKSP